jgi:hypothetical protein
MASGGFFRKIRIIVLLFILFLVGGNAYLTKIRTTEWEQPLYMVIYPINGDGSEASSRYISQLSQDDFNGIETFFTEEAESYGLALKKPLEVRLAPQLNEAPPRAPEHKSIIKVAWWSLHMRWWSMRAGSDYDGPPPDIKMYVLYYSPDTPIRLDHSLGLEKGLIGVVYGYAAKKLDGKNNVVIAHEFLHTVGATDKYDLTTRQPILPDGYAEPDKQPLYPQQFAEIMGGKIPQTPAESEMPSGLDECIIGEKTAQEIRWIKSS